MMKNKQFTIVIFDQSSNEYMTEDYQNLQEATSNFHRFDSERALDKIPVVIFNNNHHNILEIGEFYINKEDEIKGIIENI